jgi:hypothetical protein
MFRESWFSLPKSLPLYKVAIDENSHRSGSMKQFLVAAVILLFLSDANAAVPLPPDLIGVWL